MRITVEEAIEINRRTNLKDGGAIGVIDRAGLEAAVNRPYISMGGEEAYPTPVEKAAAILQSTLINHPFADGNKRTAAILMLLILRENGLKVNATQKELYDMVIKATSNSFGMEKIQNWLKPRLVNI